MSLVWELKEEYYYHDSEYYVIGGVLVELLLYAFVVLVYGFFVLRIDLIVKGTFLAIPFIYFLYCFYRSCKIGKVKLKVENGDILVYRLYLLKPYRIKKEQVIDVEIREAKRRNVIVIKTQKGKHIIKIQKNIE